MPVNTPYLQIIEQPREGVRFRYGSEGTEAPNVYGRTYKERNNKRQYPKVILHNYRDPFYLIVSCVSSDPAGVDCAKYYPHPHKLVNARPPGGMQIVNGIAIIFVKNPLRNPSLSVSVPVGIQKIKRSDGDVLGQREGALKHEENLVVPENISLVDPFGAGFDSTRKHCLKSVRLCFKAFQAESGTMKLGSPIGLPIASDIIRDETTVSDLEIKRISHERAPMCGGQEIIIICKNKIDKVKEPIEVRFYKDGWSKSVPAEVENSTTLICRSPSFDNSSDNETEVSIAIFSPSSNESSEPWKFTFYMDEMPRKKRNKISNDTLRVAAETSLLDCQVPQNRDSQVEASHQFLMNQSTWSSHDFSGSKIAMQSTTPAELQTFDFGYPMPAICNQPVDLDSNLKTTNCNSNYQYSSTSNSTNSQAHYPESPQQGLEIRQRPTIRPRDNRFSNDSAMSSCNDSQVVTKGHNDALQDKQDIESFLSSFLSEATNICGVSDGHGYAPWSSGKVSDELQVLPQAMPDPQHGMSSSVFDSSQQVYYEQTNYNGGVPSQTSISATCESFNWSTNTCGNQSIRTEEQIQNWNCENSLSNAAICGNAVAGDSPDNEQKISKGKTRKLTTSVVFEIMSTLRITRTIIQSTVTAVDSCTDGFTPLGKILVAKFLKTKKSGASNHDIKHTF